MSITYDPIGVIHSPYKQKFAIPRQPNLVAEAIAEVYFSEAFKDGHCVREIEQFSHLWLLFHFHATERQGWSSLVQPPRLGGKDKVGVFASRSPFRPNPIGLSVVKNLGTRLEGGQLILKVSGVDLLDQTPILDIKPYVAYADAIPGADSGFASNSPGAVRSIQFSEAAELVLKDYEASYPDLKQFITSVLQQDPRPAWRVSEKDEKQYGMTLYDLNIKWQFNADGAEVLAIDVIDEGSA